MIRTIRTALAAAVVTAATAFSALPLAAAEKLDLGTLSSYLNQLKTAEASFTQISNDGTLDTGHLWISRPGKMRFEYDPPNGATVMARNGAVEIYDPKSNVGPETYALNRTPLSIVLAPNVDLGRANMVVGHGFDGTSTVVSAQDPEHPDYGRIDLFFTGNPVELRKWVVVDGAGAKTTVILGEMETGHDLPSRLFLLPDKSPSRNR
ncbi:LolA family protein [Chachezhania sediminis]|uniref:LolA family protein n=1 Tax=Chachezhania sediminis TaxID=2599291 RepID=UPI00131D81E8|nr:outer membrane lipoprotein carrier protein LolA [Chachezhania sediminis]